MHGWFFLFLFFLPVKQVVIFAWRGFTVIPVSTFERVGLAVRLEAFTRMEIGLESYNCTGSTDLPAALPSLPLRTFPGTAFLAWTAIGRGTGLSFASSIYIYIYTYRQFLCNVLHKVKLSHDNSKQDEIFYRWSLTDSCVCSQSRIKLYTRNARI